MIQDPLSRRNAIKLASAAAAASVAGCATDSPASARPSTFVLVHGSWHGGWCYARVTQRLRQLGHSVYTPTLTGLGERSHLLSADITLRTHVDDVVNVVKWEDLTDIVLVGHSYGGMVVTGAAEHLRDRIRAMVYLDAFIPEARQSLFDLSAADSRSRMDALAARNGGVFINPFPAKLFGVNAPDQAWVDAKCTPHPYATYKNSLPSVEAMKAVRKKIYVRSTYSNANFEATANELRMKPGWTVLRVQSGHDMMIDKPQETTNMVMGAGT